MARREEGAYWWYATDEQPSQPGWIGAEDGETILIRLLTLLRQWHAKDLKSLSAPEGAQNAPCVVSIG